MLPILPPISLRPGNVPGLTRFISAAEHHHRCVAVLPEIHPIARAKKKTELAHAFSDRCMIPVIALSKSSHPRQNTLTPHSIP
jgi:hypothetical protein